MFLTSIYLTETKKYRKLPKCRVMRVSGLFSKFFHNREKQRKLSNSRFKEVKSRATCVEMRPLRYELKKISLHVVHLN